MTQQNNPTFAFAVPAYNEIQTIGVLLERLRTVRWRGQTPSKILVVSDCSTDGTDELVEKIAREEKKFPIVLKGFPVRSGKPAAINNALTELAGSELVVMVSADCLPDVGTIEKLLDCFDDPKVGISAGRIVTCGPETNVAVAISKILWDVHHEIALEVPKSTEITIFRNLSISVHQLTLADEADLEASIKEKGYDLKYSPDALIFNQAPLTISDYFKQRLRVTLGHMEVSERKGYSVGTMSFNARFRAIKKVIQKKEHKLTILFWGVILESLIYGCATLKYLFYKSSKTGVWSQSASTKRPFEN
jgi:cellulose synthase/poly-beta-1,6-N-acetylglucosamine synthase-like glycosyltransferase